MKLIDEKKYELDDKFFKTVTNLFTNGKKINKNIENVLNAYKSFFKDEKDNFDILGQQITGNESVVGKNNKDGHVTASGLILKDNKIFLIFHNKRQKYIQPGGHTDEDETLWEAAQREVFEETGIKTSLHSWHVLNNNIPINIDTHKIPFNKKKQEQEHFHHDFTYVFNVENDDINLQFEEVSDYKWVSVAYFFNDKLLDSATQKIIHLGLI